MRETNRSIIVCGGRGWLINFWKVVVGIATTKWTHIKLLIYTFIQQISWAPTLCQALFLRGRGTAVWTKNPSPCSGMASRLGEVLTFVEHVSKTLMWFGGFPLMEAKLMSACLQGDNIPWQVCTWQSSSFRIRCRSLCSEECAHYN